MAFILDDSLAPACPRCGGDMEFEDCTEGCDEGYFYPYDYSPIEYEPDEAEPCHLCNGKGGWWFCGNSESWCTAEGQRRGTAEASRLMF